MVDTRRIDKITSARIDNKTFNYSDLYTNFNKHPDTGFLLKNTDANSIKRALRNLILTNKGERLFQPDFGCNIRKALFEDMSDITTDTIKIYIEDAVRDYEPRIKIEQVIVAPNETHNSYEISIVYEIINNSIPQALTLTLYRRR